MKLATITVAYGSLAACGDNIAAPIEPGACNVWRPGPALLDQREDSAAFLLDDGRVLIVGGHYRYSDGKAVNTSEIIDLDAGTSTFTGEFAVSRGISGNGPTLKLADGRIFSGSPWVDDDEAAIPSELWDPATGVWTPSNPQHEGTGSSIVLADGRVLVAGGVDWSLTPGVMDRVLDRTELWEPATGQWTLGAPMSGPRVGHALVRAGDRVMAIGGFAYFPDAPVIATSEVFDPIAGTWSPGSTLAEPVLGSLAELPDGHLLSTGGALLSDAFQEETPIAQIYDPALDRWRVVAPMLRARAAHGLTVLPNGKVLVTGGSRQSFALTTASTELYDPSNDVWSEAAPMSTARRHHAAVLLPSGEVLVAGGDPFGYYSSEIYTPCE